jgi:hypothetical protein
MPGGARSRLWRVTVAGRACVARQVGLSEPSLRWLQRLQMVALAQGLRLAPLIATPGGALVSGGWTVEPMLDGRPGTFADLPQVRQALRRMHRAARAFPARPGPVFRLPIPLRPGGAETAAVHGDVHPGNILRLSCGGLALVDWEEARIGDVRLDLGFGRDAPGRAAHAAEEVVACWRAEPARARGMARLLRSLPKACAPARDAFR